MYSFDENYQEPKSSMQAESKAEGITKHGPDSKGNPLKAIEREERTLQGGS
jgi:hypothetical protein